MPTGCDFSWGNAAGIWTTGRPSLAAPNSARADNSAKEGGYWAADAPNREPGEPGPSARGAWMTAHWRRLGAGLPWQLFLFRGALAVQQNDESFVWVVRMAPYDDRFWEVA